MINTSKHQSILLMFMNTVLNELNEFCIHSFVQGSCAYANEYL